MGLADYLQPSMASLFSIRAPGMDMEAVDLLEKNSIAEEGVVVTKDSLLRQIHDSQPSINIWPKAFANLSSHIPHEIHRFLQIAFLLPFFHKSHLMDYRLPRTTALMKYFFLRIPQLFCKSAVALIPIFDTCEEDRFY